MISLRYLCIQTGIIVRILISSFKYKFSNLQQTINISKLKISIFMCKAIIALIFTLFVLTSSTDLFNQQVAEKAFTQGTHYLIHVYVDSPKHKQAFKQFCLTDKPCALLNSQVQEFEAVYEFVGLGQEEYFLILDVPNQKKYVLPVKQGLTSQDLHSFWSGFKQSKLQEYLASQKDPGDQSGIALRKIVGSTVDDFLNHNAPIKVLFQYTDRPECQVCGKMMEGFEMMAKNVSNQQIIIFGYIDIFRNDHPKIEASVVPHFLIFTQNRNKPINVQATKFGDLFDEVLVVIKEVVKPQQFEDIKRQAQIQIENQLIEKQFEKQDQLQKEQVQQKGQL